MRPAARLKRTVASILVPVDDSANSRLAVELAADLGRHIAGRANADITLLHVTRSKTAAKEGETTLFDRLLEGIDYRKVETKSQIGTSTANAVIEAAQNFDLVIFGASEASPVKRLFPARDRTRFSAWTAKRILTKARPTTVMVQRRPDILRSLVRRVLLPK